MALDIEVGTFQKDTSGTNGTTQDVTTGFIPKGIILWANARDNGTGEYAGDVLMSIGFSDGANHRVHGSFAFDNTSVEDSKFSESNAAVYIDFELSHLCRASVAFSATKFTMTYDLHNTRAVKICYFAFGGDDITGVQVSDWVSRETDGVQSITTDADVRNITGGEGFIMFLQSPFNTFSTNVGNHFQVGVGIATKTTEEAFIGIFNDDSETVSECYGAYFNDSSANNVAPFTGNMFLEGQFNGFDGLGFDINYVVTTFDFITSYLIVKGGQWQVGVATAKTSTGTQAYTTAFEPVGVITLAQRGTADNVVTDEDISFVMGAADGTNEMICGVSEGNNDATMRWGGIMETNETIAILTQSGTAAPTVDAEANFSSFNATDFTLNWANAAASAWDFAWLVGGDAASPEVTKTFTIDVVIQKELTKTFTMDVVIQQPTLTKTFTIDVVLELGVAEVTKTFTIDVVIQKELTKTFTIDVVIQQPTLTKTFTIDTILAKELTKTFTIDTILIKEITKTFTMDVVIQKELTKTFTIDTVLLKELTKTFTIDVVITGGVQVTKTFTIDVVIQKELTKTFTMDVIIQQSSLTKTFTIDTVLIKELTKTFTIDVVIQKPSLTKTFTIDVIIQEAGLTKTFTIDTVLLKELTKTFTIDVVLKALSVTKTFTMDVVISVTAAVIITKTYSLFMNKLTHVFHISGLSHTNFLNSKTHRVRMRK